MNTNWKYLFFIVSVLGTALFSGCGMKFINQTPELIPQNPSNVYTLTLEIDKNNFNVVGNSIQPFVVASGERIPMQETSPGSLHYAADVELPQDQSQAVYYFEIQYQVSSVGGPKEKVKKTNLYRFNLANRYVVQLESDRAPVGATVPVMGRGFSPSDSIVVGGQPADTEYVSENLLRFVVPTLQPGKSYPVVWESGLGDQEIGNFRVDGANLVVRPNRLVIESGSRAVLVFQTDIPAPRGGLIINDTTDIPRSIIMPEVVIPEGSRSVSVPVEAGEPGEGNLYFTVGGMSEVVVPVTVTSF